MEDVKKEKENEEKRKYSLGIGTMKIIPTAIQNYKLFVKLNKLFDKPHYKRQSIAIGILR